MLNPCSSPFVALALCGSLFFFAAACKTEIHVDDLEGYVDTLGPASFDGETLTIPFTTWDAAGDSFDVIAEFSTGGEFAPIPSVNGRIPQVTTEAARSTPHALQWSRSQGLDAAAELTIRMYAAERPEAAALLGPFVPSALNEAPSPRPDAGSQDAASDSTDD